MAAAAEAADFLAEATDGVTLEAWVRRREAGEPHAWITGRTTFCELSLHITPGVYVPRPQTEALARRAAALLPTEGSAIDLCTGAGAIAAFLLACRPSATVIGVDVDGRAAACARRNGVPAVAGDLAEPLHAAGVIDVVTAVAPYVPVDELHHLPRDVRLFEPRPALDGGADGLDVVRRVIVAAHRLLRPGGSLIVELGGDQDSILARHLAEHGFIEPQPWYDEDGDLRGLACRAAPAD